MKTHRWWAALGALVLVALPASGERPPPRIVSMRVSTPHCETDGGDVTCSAGSVYLGSLLRQSFREELPRVCADAPRGRLRVPLTYEYNEGEAYSATTKPRPACIEDFVKDLAAHFLLLYRALHAIDPTIDVRTFYAVTLTIQ